MRDPRWDSGSTARRQHRQITPTEVLVLGLLVSISFTSLFVGYALAYRLRYGLGVESAGSVAQGRTVARPTLVPTFTATAGVATPLQPSATLPAGVATPLPGPTAAPPTPNPRPPATSPPTRLQIPGLGLDVPVQPVGTRAFKDGGKVKLMWADVADAAGFHETSAYPGNPGNIVINGHRDIRGSVFRHLDKVEPGDEIVLYVGEVAYTYQVSETLVLPQTFASAKQRAENLRYIGPMPHERLTLITCTPIGLATHRLLVIARPMTEDSAGP